MYHVELRQFPHNFCRFNMSAVELRESLLGAWLRNEPVDFGERRWDPRQASLTVIEGPQLSLQELAMGRGWRNALRRGSDVSSRLLARAAPAGAAPTQASWGRTEAIEPSAAVTARHKGVPAGEELELAVSLLAMLGDDLLPLLRAWQLALERHPELSPSQCLALAEEFIGR